MTVAMHAPIDHDNALRFGEHLKHLRANILGCSQVELAKRVGTSRSVIHDWEYGEHVPTLRFRPRLRELDPEYFDEYLLPFLPSNSA